MGKAARWDCPRWALSWLVVATVGLAPMLVYWLARVIGRAFRRKGGGPPAGSAPVQGRQEERGCPPARGGSTGPPADKNSDPQFSGRDP
jgi:hypothetical protein